MDKKYFDSVLVSNPFQATIVPEGVVVTITDGEVKPMKIKTAQKALERIKNFLKENCKHWKQDVGYIDQALKEADEYKKEQEQKNKDNTNTIRKFTIDLYNLAKFAQLFFDHAEIENYGEYPGGSGDLTHIYFVEDFDGEESDLILNLRCIYGKEAEPE